MILQIYKYLYGGSYYYGQGFKEDEIRNALEVKLNLPKNTLKLGNTNIHPIEMKKVLSSKLSVNDIKYVNPNLKNLHINNTLNECISTNNWVSKNFNSFLEQLSYVYNIPPHYMRLIDKDYTIKDILSLSNYKIIIKTHKNIKDNITGEITVISRVDELRSQIVRLMKMDYFLFFEVNDLEGEYERLNAAYQKACEIAKEMQVNLQYVTKKVLETMHSYPRKISDVVEMIEQQNNAYFNTGYYVNGNSVYFHNTYQEILDEFMIIYEKIRSKINRYSFNNIPMFSDKPDDFTMLEYIDSFIIIHNNNNHYLK